MLMQVSGVSRRENANVWLALCRASQYPAKTRSSAGMFLAFQWLRLQTCFVKTPLRTHEIHE
jgi:hypothetical protein